MPVTFRAPEPVRFDVDPPEDWEPSLRSQEEVDALRWDQLLNKGKRGVNWLADQLFGRTAEEEFETAMVEFANPLISLVPRQPLSRLLQRIRQQGDPTAPDRLWRNVDEYPQGATVNLETDWSPYEFPPNLRQAAEWVAERYPNTLGHVQEVNVSPPQPLSPSWGKNLQGYFRPRTVNRLMEQTGLEAGDVRGIPPDELPRVVSDYKDFVPFNEIWMNPRGGFPDDVIPDDELVDILTHELTHAGQHLRGVSQEGAGFAAGRNRPPRSNSPHADIAELEDHLAYLQQPIEQSARVGGAKSRLNYLRDVALQRNPKAWPKPRVPGYSGENEARKANEKIQELAKNYWDSKLKHSDKWWRKQGGYDHWLSDTFKPALRRGGATWQRLAKDMAEAAANLETHSASATLHMKKKELSQWDTTHPGDVFEP